MNELQPAMPLGGPPESRAVWVGECQLANAEAAEANERWRLLDGEGFDLARLLVREGVGLRGFVTVSVANENGIATIVPADIARQARDLLPVEEISAAPQWQGLVSVVLCSRDRPDYLQVALESILACDDSDFEVVVVDNASTTTGNADVVAEIADPRVRLVPEPVPGLSRARNRGVLEARGEVVAFTDDDVAVDPGWITGVRRGFARAEDVVCVTGLVPAGELRTVSQRWFEARVTWNKHLRGRTYRMSTPPPDMPLFPLQVGVYGTGASMAFRRAELIAMGGVDEVLGAGTRTKGGEDLDLFLRLLIAGYALVVEPTAFVWHRHRSSLGDLDSQVVGYGRGLGALLTKIMFNPRNWPLVVSRLPAAIHRVRTLGLASDEGERPDPALSGPALLPPAGMTRLATKERLCLLTGPRHYLSSRWHARNVPPLIRSMAGGR